MTVTSLPVQRTPAPRHHTPEWVAAACTMPNPTGLDFADLTEDARVMDSYLDDDLVLHAGAYTAAKHLCSVCPLLLRCRARARCEVDVAGVAGGEDETERAEWRRRNRVTVEATRLAVLVPDGHQLLLDLSTETRPSGQRKQITVEELVAVMRLTVDGWTVEDIADRLVTVTATGRIRWTVKRAKHARAILAGSEGHSTRAAGVA